MNIAGMNAAGGPVGGPPMMNNGRPRGGNEMDPRAQLNTYIYDYFCKNGYWALARMVNQDLPINIDTERPKPSPSGRNMNGVDSMENDSKDELLKQRPDDLPIAKIPGDQSAENSFLLDWWCQFWDIYSAARMKGKASPAQQYLAHTRAQTQMRNNSQQQILLNNSLQYRNMMQIQPNGMGMPGDLQRKAMSNNRNAYVTCWAGLQNMQKQQMMQTQMQRDGSGMDMGSQRPQSPGSVDNAPSPNKRPRLENNVFNGQPMAGTMLLANGINPGDLPGNQFNAFSSQTPNVQQKSIEVYTQSLAQQQRTALNNHTMAKGMNPGVPQGSPMGQPSLDGSSDAFAGNANRMPGGAPGQPQGNHALQDYQMQLMLLEQQNKKRLLMARQEQDNMSGPAHGQAPIGAPGFAPTMSPQGSRAGPSPNPNDQMKRGTPKLNQTGLPGSPVPDGHMQQNRASPVPNGFDPIQMPPGVPPQYYGQMPSNHMRPPPSSHPGFNQQYNQQQIDQLARSAGRMPNGNTWPGAPPQMMPSQGQQQGPMATAQQRSAMLPPPAPPTGEPGRTNPPSPQPAAPPTPSQAAKPNPRNKKDTKETKKKPAKNKAAITGATPASEAESHQTPTPSTPITPVHHNSFSKLQNGAGQQPNVQPQAPAAASAPPVQPAPMDTNGAPFGSIGEDNGFDLGFGPLDGPDVLENFDFDSFLHTEDNGTFGSLGNDFGFGGTDGVEASTGDL
ncbi:hypothetical protein AOQ84DRAFT_292579 [Glonium stellatum]|uniref:LisH domain-containing protein n=1 Tax=Glonium stellatum TaxID=574774 RepID=A0A8E2F188_9PEZI|nr:hypothetical protein AOQ84DRAFT_292579 [Glonium stellatum]